MRDVLALTQLRHGVLTRWRETLAQPVAVGLGPLLPPSRFPSAAFGQDWPEKDRIVVASESGESRVCYRRPDQDGHVRALGRLAVPLKTVADEQTLLR